MSQNFRNKAVLVVDDFQNMRSTLKRMLQSIGVDEVDLAANGREALERMAHRNYDIVLCDYNLGDERDGQQVLEEAKYHRMIGPATIFVMITAENTMEMVMGAIECRPDDYLAKPFNKDLLKKRLERLLEKKDDLHAIDDAIDKKELSRAVTLCDERIAKKPRNINELQKLKTDLLIEMGDLERAEQTCMEVLAHRNLPWARLALGRIRFLSEQYPEACDILQQLIDEHRTQTEAYDLLAKCLRRQNRDGEAQEVLTSAVKLSPRAIRRQETLGKLADQNGDFTTAEHAYRRAVALGRHSVYRSAAHYTGLAKAQRHTTSGREAAKTLERLRKDFKGDTSALLQAAMAESDLHRANGRMDLARSTFEEATQLFESAGGTLSPETTIEMGKQFLVFGEKEKGLALVQDVVRNHHENQELRGVAQEAFKEAGLEEGNRLVDDAHREVVKLNNEGVALFKAGKLHEAIELFEKAAERLPENRTVNLNTALVMLKRAQREKRADDAALGRIRQYLERAGKSDPGNRTYRELRQLYESLR